MPTFELIRSTLSFQCAKLPLDDHLHHIAAACNVNDFRMPKKDRELCSRRNLFVDSGGRFVLVIGRFQQLKIDGKLIYRFDNDCRFEKSLRGVVKEGEIYGHKILIEIATAPLKWRGSIRVFVDEVKLFDVEIQR